METIIRDNLLQFALSNISSLTINMVSCLAANCAQILDCHYDWRRALDVGDVVDVVLIDFTKSLWCSSSLTLTQKAGINGSVSTYT